MGVAASTYPRLCTHAEFLQAFGDMLGVERSRLSSYGSPAQHADVTKPRLGSGGGGGEELSAFVGSCRALFRARIFDEKSRGCPIASSFGLVAGNLKTSRLRQASMFKVLFNLQAMCMDLTI